MHLSCNIRMFADDCIIYRKINSVSDNTSLQNDLRSTQKRCNIWLMKQNHSTFKTVFCHRSRNPLAFSYQIAGTNPELVPCYKYLGVILCSDSPSATHIPNIISSANKALEFVKYHLRHGHQNVQLLAYQSLVRAN